MAVGGQCGRAMWRVGREVARKRCKDLLGGGVEGLLGGGVKGW